MSRDDDMIIPQYSLGQPPKRVGLGGLSAKATVILGVGFMAWLFSMLLGVGAEVGVPLIVVTVIWIALISIPWGGRKLGTALRMWGQHLSRVRSGEDVYLSGEMSKVPGGRHRLPGTLSRTTLAEGVDADHQPFAVIVDEGLRTATLMLDCQLTGQSPMTQEERNLRTAEWSRWLSMLSLAGDVESVAIVVGTRPGTGQLVAQEVASIVADEIPPVAAQIMFEAGEELSRGVPEIVSHIAITVRVDGNSITNGAFIDLLGIRLPGLYRQLAWAGIIASPMTAEDITARAHQFFNPATEPDFEALEVAGLDHSLNWLDAGPGYARVKSGSYEHEGCESVTWEMSQAPRSTFEDTILTGLLAPHPRIERKRVTLIYRPYEAGKGVSLVEGEHRDAVNAANSTKSIRSANAELRLEHTDAARKAQARGAQLGLYSMFVTATVDDPAKLPRVEHDVVQLGAGSAVRLQKMTLQQDTGFITTCGLGQIPWKRETTLSQTLTG